MDHFDYAVEAVLKNEGGWSDNPYDPGGATNLGITFRLFKSIYPDATLDDLRNLTPEKAKPIYRKVFWDAIPFDKINSMRIATSIFDASVNSGIPQGVKILQQACNHILICKLMVDGVLGKNTLHAVNNLDATQLLAEVKNQRKMFYVDLARKKSSLRIFLTGWLRRAET